MKKTQGHLHPWLLVFTLFLVLHSNALFAVCPTIFQRAASMFQNGYRNEEAAAIKLYNKFPGLRKHYGYLQDLDYLSVEEGDMRGSKYQNALGSRKIGDLMIAFRITWDAYPMGLGAREGSARFTIEVAGEKIDKEKVEALVNQVASQTDAELINPFKGKQNPSISFDVNKTDGIDKAIETYKSFIKRVERSPEIIKRNK